MDITVHKTALVQVMAWCRQATSNYLRQCWPRYVLPYGVTPPQWVYNAVHHHPGKHNIPDSEVHGSNMGPIWVLSTPDGPRFSPMNLAIHITILSGLVIYKPLSVIELVLHWKCIENVFSKCRTYRNQVCSICHRSCAVFSNELVQWWFSFVTVYTHKYECVLQMTFL